MFVKRYVLLAAAGFFVITNRGKRKCPRRFSVCPTVLCKRKYKGTELLEEFMLNNIYRLNLEHASAYINCLCLTREYFEILDEM